MESKVCNIHFVRKNGRGKLVDYKFNMHGKMKYNLDLARHIAKTSIVNQNVKIKKIVIESGMSTALAT